MFVFVNYCSDVFEAYVSTYLAVVLLILLKLYLKLNEIPISLSVYTI